MRKFITMTGVTITVMMAIVLVLYFGKQAPALDSLSISALRLQAGPYVTQKIEDVIVDRSRATQVNGDYAGTNSRTLASTIWYPDRNVEGGFPLIIYSHGFSANRNNGKYLAEELVSKGYVVVAADFPLTSTAAPSGPMLNDVVNQPADISFLIDTMLNYNQNSEHPLAGMIDPESIGLMGTSLGGMTATLAAYHLTMADKRVKAVLSLAGPTDPFTDVFFQQHAPAFLMLAGSADALVPHVTNALPVLHKIPNAQLVTIANGSHLGFSGNTGFLRWISHPDAFGCYMAMRNLKSSNNENSLIDLLGTPEQGISDEVVNEFCKTSPLPEAIYPLRQQQISRLVASSFFDAEFSRSDENRNAAKIYLQKTLAKEFAEVSYSRANTSAR